MPNYSTLDELVAAGMPQHQLDAIRDGGSAIFQGQSYTAEGLGVSAAGGLESAVVSAQEAARLKSRIFELETQLAEKSESKLEPGNLEAPDHSELIEALIPDTEAGLKVLKTEKVVKIAEYRNLETEGKDKAELIAELLKKEGE